MYAIPRKPNIVTETETFYICKDGLASRMRLKAFFSSLFLKIEYERVSRKFGGSWRTKAGEYCVENIFRNSQLICNVAV